MPRDLAHIDRALHATRLAAHELLDELLEERHGELTRRWNSDAKSPAGLH
jgi:phage terminase large subunit-like protein